MRKGLQVISLLALVVIVASSVMFVAGAMELDRVKLLTLIATIVWFGVTPCWMGREERT